ncbi:MAG: NADH-quinone oxidoreductase subunit L [Verrucomicrobiales bacterium]|nr:NADH-quinone oxidoreductase subunit L [Verrucomicrobiales bacterium]|tara:strand:+ start:9129 stop:11048 length:1920 start_codon:yes stop_codon:yes gene_type:complete
MNVQIPFLFNAAPLVLFLPLLSAVVIWLFIGRDAEKSATFSIGCVAAAFIGSWAIFLSILLGDAEAAEMLRWNWLQVDNLQVSFGLIVDRLSALMLLVVTGVALLVQIYSLGYMKDDPGKARYYCFLSLFTFSMLGIVLANNLVMMFVFWELVGVSSYLLIGFWFHRPAAADAGKKAFLTNRVGDFGFLFGVILVWAGLGTVHIGELQHKFGENAEALGALTTIAGLLIFCGAVGKSAQFPLHVWLPDAMEGPTPVSALIHAATMVAAGVYMLCRVAFMLNTNALHIIGWVGAITSLLAALMAIQQNDIKRILAYSTLSQLGYMVMAVGLGSPNAAMFHLTTHAFFKAMLFLGAGSVICALHHEQDIWKMGGLKFRMERTCLTFFIGTVALCGVWPFAGFFSKDAILATALDHGNYVLFIIGGIVAGLTAFYMTRLMTVAFGGNARTEAAAHAVASPRSMTYPLLILAIPSMFIGFCGVDFYLHHIFPTGHTSHMPGWSEMIFAPINHSPLGAIFGTATAIIGWRCARGIYKGVDADPLPLMIGGWARLMRDKFYFDEIYNWFIKITQEALATVADWFDRWIIGGLMVSGSSGFVALFGRALRLVQTGNVQTYGFWLVAGIVIVIFMMFPDLPGGGAKN